MHTGLFRILTLFAIPLLLTACPEVQPPTSGDDGPDQATVTVPDVTGLERADAEAAILAASLTLSNPSEQFSSTIPAGQVIGQMPAAGSPVGENSAVRLIVSSGPAPTKVPLLRNQSQEDAEAALASAGLSVSNIRQEFSATVPAGRVLDQIPPAGSNIPANGSVILVVSKGPATFVPNLVGQSLASANDILSNVGLRAGLLTVSYNDAIPAAQVLGQTPAAGEGVSPNTPVNLVVSGGPEPIPVPDVAGLARASAETAIREAGLTVGAVTEEFSDTIPAGQVISQSPVADQPVSEGSAVQLVVSGGPEPVTVPQLQGLTQTAASDALRMAGLTLGTVTEEYSTDFSIGLIIRHNPGADEQAPPGSAVAVVISKGVEMVPVPEVVGLTEAAAASAIADGRLTLGAVSEQFDDNVPEGLVISQTPMAEAMVAVESTVSIIVSMGPETSEDTESLNSDGGVFELDDATLETPAGALDAPVDVTISRNRPEARVDRANNEQEVTQIYTIEHDGAFPLLSGGDPFEFSLAFDADDIDTGESGEINDVTLFFRVTTPEASFRLAGTLAGNTLTAEIDTLPVNAALQVVYNPNMRAVFSDPVEQKTLTQNPDWRTTAFRCTYDWTSSPLQQAVAELEGISQGNVTETVVAETMRDIVANGARDGAVYLEGAGLREANLRVVESGAPGFMDLHIGQFSSDSHFVDGGTAWRQLNINTDLVDAAPGDESGSVRAVIAHELLHACVNGYEYQFGPGGGYTVPLFESLAEVVGHTVDRGAIATRDDSPHLLGSQLGLADITCDTGGCSFEEDSLYALSDWFAYLGKRFSGDTLAYVGGGASPGNGLLESLRVANEQSPPALPDEALNQFYGAMQTSFESQFMQPLSEVYWDYARNRAYEHNDESRLRTEDANAARFSLSSALFDLQHVQEFSFSDIDQRIEIAASEVPLLQSIPPLSSRAVILRTAGFEADVEIVFNRSEWTPDADGNSMMVKVYKTGFDGVELPAGDDSLYLTGFGDDTAAGADGSLVILLSNVSTTQSYSVSMDATTGVATGGFGTLMGRVTNASTGSAISDATIDVRGRNRNDTDEIILTTTSNSNGQFTLTDVPSGYAELTLSKANYVTTIQTVTIVSDISTQINPSLIVGVTSQPTGGASGTVIDTVTGDGIGGATLELRPGILRLRDTDYPVVATATTSNGGAYSFSNIDAGTYTAFASRDGYIDDTFVVFIVGGATRGNQDGDMSTTVNVGEIRIVLTWGEDPSDLDSHLTGPAGGGRFHVYFANPVAGTADLDLDDVTSFGPETITIRSRTAGTYRYSVHDFTNLSSSSSREMSNSGANVKVIRNTGIVEFNITPDTPATLWTVFEIDGTTGELREVNEYAFVSNPSAVTKALGWRYGLGAEVPAIFRDLPPKK